MQPNVLKIPLWLQHLVASLGGAGLFVVTFLDSSLLSFPLVADFLVIEAAMRKPALMPYYAAMAALGSLAGCIWLYLLAKKGGEAFFRRGAGPRATKIRNWVEAHGFLSAFLPAILPPPIPFKPFVLAEGAFQVPLRTFIGALLLGRSLRYFGEGLLAVRYGDAALRSLFRHKVAFSLLGILLCIGIFLLNRLIKRISEPPQ